MITDRDDKGTSTIINEVSAVYHAKPNTEPSTKYSNAIMNAYRRTKAVSTKQDAKHKETCQLMRRRRAKLCKDSNPIVEERVQPQRTFSDFWSTTPR